jgi:hypothetical protein
MDALTRRHKEAAAMMLDIAAARSDVLPLSWQYLTALGDRFEQVDRMIEQCQVAMNERADHSAVKPSRQNN